MFTGIVRRVGVVVETGPAPFGRTLVLDPGDWEHVPRPGDSIAVNGCCLTVARRTRASALKRTGDGRVLAFDVVRQTLDATALEDLRAGDLVNLEPPITPATPLGGHLVQGHIDGVGTVTRVVDTPSERRLRIALPEALADLVVEKGSIAVDGVSLTVASLGDAWFEVALIPTTIQCTTLGRLEKGRRVNLETDYIVKTVVSWLKRQGVTR